ncbi:MAG: 50S ribosomal protein L4 [Saprospiraceae bacterium]|nr:50S ribosomal protein L4 [Saprospiraceae bacterium]
MKLVVLSIDGSKTGRKVDLPDNIFGIEPNEHVLYLSVKQHLANKRQGTHKAKERGEIAGSTKKIKKQKGTGTARAGSIKSPIFRGGGRIFGPRPKDYSFKLNKKVKILAKSSALSAKAAAGDIVLVEDFTFDQPKSSQFAQVLSGLGVNDAKSLVVTNDYDKNLYLSARNLPKSGVMNAKDIFPYAILNAGKLVLTEGSIAEIVKTFESK